MKRILRWGGGVIAVLLLVLLTAPLWFNANTFRPLLESDLSSALGREVKLGDLKLELGSGSVTASDLSVADDPIFNRTPFVHARSLKLSVEIWPLLFSHQLNVTGLTIDQPEIIMLQSPAGDWNFSKMGGQRKSAAPAPSAPAEKSNLQLSVKLVKISGGRFTMGKTGGHQRPLVLQDVNLELRDYSSDTAFPFSFSANVAGGGAIKLDGKAGPVDATDASLTPIDAQLGITRLDLAASGLTEGTPGVGALLSFDGSGGSHNGRAQATGKLKLEKLKLARQGTPAQSLVELDFDVSHDLRKQAGTIRQGDIHIGKAVAHLTGSYARPGDSAVLKMTLSAPDMPVTELATLLPAMGIVLPAGSTLQGGTANAHFEMEGQADRLVTTGSLAFDHARLAGFNLGKKMETIEKLAGIQAGPDTEIQTLSANLRMAPEGTSAQNLKLIVPAIGELSGNGTISPENALAFQMTAAVHTGGLISAVSDKPIPFKVEGTASDPVFRPDVRSLATQEVKSVGIKAAGSLLNGLLGKKKN